MITFATIVLLTVDTKLLLNITPNASVGFLIV